MNSYELSRTWFDWCFENPEKINPNHSALYFFTIEHCNRLGWRSKFGLPTEMAKEAIGIKSYNTYIKTLNDLVDWGFIKMVEKSKNQYSSNIVALLKNDKALDKALDKAIAKASKKRSESIDSIDKPINLLTIEPITDIFSFDEFWFLYPNKVAKSKCKTKYETLSNEDKVKIKNTLSNFIKYKPFKEYNHPNPMTYLNQKRWDDEININFNKQKNGTTKITDTEEFKHLIDSIRSTGERI